MPVLVVWDLEYNPNTQKLIAGTYARGLQTIDVSSLMVSTSAGQMQQENLLNIYPNPTSDFAEIVYRGTLIECLIYDAFGKQVMSSRDKKINLSALPAGAYLLKAQTDRGLMQQKIIRK
jgi:hypothetical protein